MAKPNIICLLGPTAVGKTRIAYELARDFPIEIVNVDSVMIYQGLDIGSAKPSLAEQRLVANHLLDILAPDQLYSVAQFIKDVERVIGEVRGRGKVPVLVGGTMLYFKGLFDGLQELPVVDVQLRSELVEISSELGGLEKLYARLMVKMPQVAKRLHPNDRQRVVRALELAEAGVEMPGKWVKRVHPDYNFQVFAILPETKEKLWDDVRIRCKLMLNSGWVNEVECLLNSYGEGGNIPGLRAVGYSQIKENLQGHIDRDHLEDRIVFATRQLAKRQTTWLNSLGDLVKIHGGNYKPIKKALDLCC